MNTFLLFHTVIEVFSAAVAWCVFALTWNTRIHRTGANGFFLLLGIACLFVGGLDLIHSLAYKGMNVFPGYDANLATQLWMAARYLQSLSFLAAAGLLLLQQSGWMKLSSQAGYWLLAGYAVITALLLAAIFTRLFPVCFIEGSGLTPFKRVGEYVICVILAAAAVLLRRCHRSLDPEMQRFLMIAIVVSILSELAFTLYTDVYGLLNTLGHGLKIIVFLALYRAIVQIGIQKPYTLLSQDLHDSEMRYRTIVENSNDALFVHDFTGNITDANEIASRMLGYRRDELVGANLFDLSRAPDDHSPARRMAALRENDSLLFEAEALPQHAAPMPIEFSVRAVSRHGDGIIQSFVRDITQRKQAEAYREMSRTILQILNEPGTLADSIQRILAIIKARTGFDAVGIRLQDGEDFPYFARDGFPEDFLQTENSLLECSADGEISRDEDGKVRLECTCGLVISGKIDAANPFFTPGGSFWINDSFPLLNIPTDRDPRFHPRNRCMHQGFASIALVPIRNRERNIGLLQLNDRRKGCFSLHLIEIIEGIASNIGSALLRRQAEDALRESEAALRSSLAEKELLLQEVHHRVKNNLAAILGLIDLQGQTLDGQAGGAALAELKIRVKSMALIHEHLYHSESFACIDFQDYLEALIAYLYASHEHCCAIRVSVTATGVKMGLHSAVPCGLLITEAVTNAFKYAFPAGLPHSGAGACEITVSAAWDGAMYTLAIADNGVGLPVDVDWMSTQTLGLRLVKMLAQLQLQGQIELDRSSGTAFRLQFAPRTEVL